MILHVQQCSKLSYNLIALNWSTHLKYNIIALNWFLSKGKEYASVDIVSPYYWQFDVTFMCTLIRRLSEYAINTVAPLVDKDTNENINAKLF